MIDRVVEELAGLVDKAAHRRGRILLVHEPTAEILGIPLVDRRHRLDFEKLDAAKFGLFEIGASPFLQIGPAGKEVIPEPADRCRNAAVVRLIPRGNQPERRKLFVQIIGDFIEPSRRRRGKRHGRFATAFNLCDMVIDGLRSVAGEITQAPHLSCTANADPEDIAVALLISTCAVVSAGITGFRREN